LHNHFELGLEGVDYDVEFSDMHRVLSTDYWPNISHVEASMIIKQAFPSITTKRKSKAGSKKTFYLGIRKRNIPTSIGTASESLSADPAYSSQLIAPDLKSLHLEVGRPCLVI
jgi:hypothetical protein